MYIGKKNYIYLKYFTKYIQLKKLCLTTLNGMRCKEKKRWTIFRKFKKKKKESNFVCVVFALLEKKTLLFIHVKQFVISVWKQRARSVPYTLEWMVMDRFKFQGRKQFISLSVYFYSVVKLNLHSFPLRISTHSLISSQFPATRWKERILYGFASSHSYQVHCSLKPLWILIMR